MSKATVRNTMTTDAEGGQYKGEVHQESEKGVFASDRRFVLNILNTSFRTLLELHGFTPGDGKFVCVEEDHICLKDRITIDMQASQKVVIPPVYWYDKYGYPIPEGGPQAVVSSPPTELSEMRNELQGMRAQLCEVQKREQERADNAPLPITPPVRRKGFFG